MIVSALVGRLKREHWLYINLRMHLNTSLYHSPLHSENYFACNFLKKVRLCRRVIFTGR